MATHIAEAIGTSQNVFLFFVHIFQLLNKFKLCFLKATIHKSSILLCRHLNTFTVLYAQHDY